MDSNLRVWIDSIKWCGSTQDIIDSPHCNFKKTAKVLKCFHLLKLEIAKDIHLQFCIFCHFKHAHDRKIDMCSFLYLATIFHWFSDFLKAINLHKTQKHHKNLILSLYCYLATADIFFSDAVSKQQPKLLSQELATSKLKGLHCQMVVKSPVSLIGLTHQLFLLKGNLHVW